MFGGETDLEDFVAGVVRVPAAEEAQRVGVAVVGAARPGRDDASENRQTPCHGAGPAWFGFSAGFFVGLMSHSDVPDIGPCARLHP